MAAPVWVLSVDLQTKTATFTTGLSDAAKGARGSFQDIQSGAKGMGASVGGDMRSTRESVMLLGEEFGIHLPRALTSFIAHLGPVGAAMETAFPFIAIIAAAVLLTEKLAALRQAGIELTEDQVKFGTAAQDAFNTLNDKLLQAQIRADELRGDHLGALAKQLELIDNESMKDLVHAFEEVAKAADVVFKGLESHWYTFGEGSTGAKNALDDFRAHYALLATLGRSDEASGLLTGTLNQAEQVLALQKQMQGITYGPGREMLQFGHTLEFEKLRGELKAKNAGWTDNEVAAQQQLVDGLRDYVGLEWESNAVKQQSSANAKTADSKSKSGNRSGGASSASKLADDEREGRSLYMSELFETNREAVAAVQQGEREQIENTAEKSQERLTAIQNALLAERQMGLDNTQFYRQLQLQEIAAQKAFDEEQVKEAQQAVEAKASVLEEGAQKEIERRTAMARLQQDGGASARDLGRLQMDQEIANIEYAIKAQAIEKELELYRNAGMQETAQARKLQMQLDALNQEHADKTAAFAQQEINTERNAALQVAEQWSQSFLQVATGHERMSKLMIQSADAAMSHLLSGAFQMMEQDKMNQISSAKTAAAGAMSAVAKIPIVGPALSVIAGAAVFAGAMAFESGGIVPGIGRGDIVPAMLSPGEGIVPGGLMDKLSTLARNGGLDGGGPRYAVTIHHHVHASALDADGLEQVLAKNADAVQKHVERSLRRMNH